MVDIISKIVTNILSALYQEAGAALLFALMAIMIYIKYRDQKIKSILVEFFSVFKQKSLRSLFWLFFYCGMILYRTVLCRPAYYFPLADVFGGWKIIGDDAAFYTDGIENLLLFIPFTYLCLKHNVGCNSKRNILIKSVKRSFLLSIGIELSQLFLRAGTFQISDLVLNTLGGFIGACLFCAVTRLSNSRKESNQ